MYIKHVQLVSGGLDSLLVTKYLIGQTEWQQGDSMFLWVDYGQPEAAQEEAAVDQLWPGAMKIRSRGCLGGAIAEGTFYPCRNLWLAATAVMNTQANVIWMGGMMDDSVIDQGAQAYAEMSALLTKHAQRPIEIRSPFLGIDKSEAVRRFLAAGGSADVLRSTWSCYAPRRGQRCLACNACFRWSVALRSNGLDVPLPCREIIIKYLSRLHTFPIERTWAILRSLMPNVVVSDIDGTLTVESAGWDYGKRTFKQDARKTINRFSSAGMFVVIYSSRRECDREQTERWLEDNDIHYHALLLNKPPSKFWVDDDAVHLHES